MIVPKEHTQLLISDSSIQSAQSMICQLISCLFQKVTTENGYHMYIVDDSVDISVTTNCFVFVQCQ